MNMNPALGVKAVPCHCGNQSASANGISIDTLGYGELAFVYQYGTTTTFTSATADWTLEESSDDSAFTAITGAALTQHTTTQDAKRFAIRLKSLVGRKRYIRAVLTKGGTTLATAATGPLNNGGVLLAAMPGKMQAAADFLKTGAGALYTEIITV